MHANELTRYFFNLDGHPVIIEISKNLPPPRLAKVEPGVVAPVAPAIDLPARIPAKTPIEVGVHGKRRVVAACVANVLRLIADGAREVELRPETHAKFVAAVPEIRLVRDVGRKVRSNRSWWVVG